MEFYDTFEVGQNRTQKVGEGEGENEISPDLSAPSILRRGFSMDQL